jgi:hypothetical protein
MFATAKPNGSLSGPVIYLILIVQTFVGILLLTKDELKSLGNLKNSTVLKPPAQQPCPTLKVATEINPADHY